MIRAIEKRAVVSTAHAKQQVESKLDSSLREPEHPSLAKIKAVLAEDHHSELAAEAAIGTLGMRPSANAITLSPDPAASVRQPLLWPARNSG
jgi:hypothetical protein